MNNLSIPQASKRAILYARVSKDDRKNATSSIEAQLDACRAYCVQRGYSVIDEIFEEPNRATSGADWLPELDRLMRLAPLGTFDTVVCYAVDRLARDKHKFIATELELRSQGVVVEYVIGQFEDTDEGFLMKDIVSGFAEYERRKTQKRTHNGQLRSVQTGNTLLGGGAAPYGYDAGRVEGKRALVINEQEAAVVRLIFDLYAVQMYSLYDICRYLGERGIPLPTKSNASLKRSMGIAWAPSSVSGLLDQETYIGVWHYGKTKTVKDARTGKKRSVSRPREEWLAVAVPAIISEELFAAAAERKQTNKIQRGHQHKFTYTLGGMTRCGHCQHWMTGTTSVVHGHPYGYFRCTSHTHRAVYGQHYDNVPYRVDSVEAAVRGWIESVFQEPATLRDLLEQYQEQQKDRYLPQRAMLESTQQELNELEGRKKRLIEAYSKGGISLEELIEGRSPLDKRIKDLTQTVAILQAETEPQMRPSERIEAIEAMAAEVRAAFSGWSKNKETQRKVFQLLEVQVALSYDGQDRWADVTCTLGSNFLLVENTTTKCGGA